MKKALMLAPMGSVHRRFNRANILALQEMGFEVELCANFNNGEGPEIHNQKYVQECTANGIKTHSIPFERHSLSGSVKCLPDLKRLISEQHYDLVHTHTETGGLLLKLAHSVKGSSRFVYTPHGMSFWKGSGMKSQFVYRPLERWICSGMDLNLGMNMEEVDNLLRWNKKTGRYVHGVGLNIERMQRPSRLREDVRKEFNIGVDEKFIVSVGELDDNKNHSTVIKALGGLKRRDFKYVVCGVGGNKDILLEMAASMGLSENVILAGYRSDIPDILNAADIFVFPSFHEGMPVSALEAMACGLPIICSSIRGNVDIVKYGDNGYLFDPTDDVTLAMRLEELMDDTDKCKNMGQKNLELVKPFSLESVKEELKEIYGSIC